MNNIHVFCKERKIGKRIQDAFVAYCRASIGDYYQIGNGKTVTGILLSFTMKEIEEMWGEFVIELKRTLEADDRATQKTGE